MKKILMIGTGGTIASCETETGLAPRLSADELLSYIPSVKSLCAVELVQVCSIDSTNMTPYYWKLIVEAIRDNYDKYDGFVVCHGTDTMSYSAAAISYMIQDSPKPIVFTGSQKPINAEDTDARVNLSDSFCYACDDASCGVTFVFDGKVILGTRAKKVRAKSYNAFESMNFPYIAVIRDGNIVRYVIPQKPAGRPVFHTEMSDRVFLLKLIPGINADILEYVFHHYDGIVIESYGVGGIPQALVDTFYRLMNEDSVGRKMVVLTTQVAKQGSNMTVYEVGKKVKEDLHLLEAFDMTTEATVTKLMWILSMPELNETERRSLFYKTVNSDFLFTRLAEKS